VKWFIRYVFEIGDVEQSAILSLPSTADVRLNFQLWCNEHLEPSAPRPILIGMVELRES